jgi:tellurite resistance protein
MEAIILSAAIWHRDGIREAMMTETEKLELLKAALEVAVADGEIRRSERGVLEGLAVRAGVGRASFEAMLNAAQREDTRVENILLCCGRTARTALELLVAEARIDGEISDQERDVLIRLGNRLGITGDEFQTIYQAGIARADAIRKRQA